MSVTDFQELYRAYLEDVAAAERNRRPGEGLFGIGKGPAEDPCHDRFVEKLEAMLNLFAASKPDSTEVKPILDYIFSVPPESRALQSAYWMLLAVHTLTLPLIPFLNSADAVILLETYEKTYPRRERFPAQKSVLSALRNFIEEQYQSQKKITGCEI